MTRAARLLDPWVAFQSEDVPGPAILRRSKVRISPNDRGFMFADGVYEVIRSYSGRFFHLKEHLRRLRHSLKSTEIEFKGLDAIETGARELLRMNGLETADATVYVQITRGIYPRQHAFPARPVVPTFYMEVNRLAPCRQEMETGVRVITVPDIRWSRCDIKSIALLGNVLAAQQACLKRAFEVIQVRDGVLTEGTRTNVFGVRRGRVITHAQSGSILGGITRDVILTLCHRQGIPVSESGIRENRLSQLDELFLAGTTVEVMPVVRVNDRRVGTGRPGPVTRRLQQAFRAYLAEEIEA
jgi:D-alanine transaminase